MLPHRIECGGLGLRLEHGRGLGLERGALGLERGGLGLKPRRIFYAPVQKYSAPGT